MEKPMPHGIALSLLITALLLSGCGNGGSGTPNGGGGADTATSVPSETPGDSTTELGPAPEQAREAVPEQTEPAPFPELAATEETSSSGPAAGEITLVDLPWESVQEQIAAHQGKVVVVDLWATYCDPCRATFPGLVTLSKQDPENIVCISVSLDDPSDAERREMALAFLKEQQATFTNILCTTDETKLYDEILKIGGIPAVYVYGRDGQMAKLFTGRSPDGGEHTYEAHITPFVTELAATK
jgi:thiol-disulfide isomerase/thioredoxin